MRPTLSDKEKNNNDETTNNERISRYETYIYEELFDRYMIS